MAATRSAICWREMSTLSSVTASYIKLCSWRLALGIFNVGARLLWSGSTSEDARAYITSQHGFLVIVSNARVGATRS
jgi:hypothetical protein